ncbi:MAG: hypothetical protein NC453_26685 [Muribaculum sp.]|nr:hypothetical protein [Muribaculum sp.]
MNNKKYIIAGLTVLLAVMSILLSFGIGTTSESIVDEENKAFQNRKEIRSLSSERDRASYAAGMTRVQGAKVLDSFKDNELAPAYYIISHPETRQFYQGMLYAFASKNQLSDPYKITINPRCFVAGFYQTIENKVRVPNLSGSEATSYLTECMMHPETSAKSDYEVDTITVEEVVEEVTE